MINAYVWIDSLQVLTQPVHLGQEEIDVGLRHGGAGDDVPEEVGPSIIRLIADHQRAGLHHAALQDGTDLEANGSLVSKLFRKGFILTLVEIFP